MGILDLLSGAQDDGQPNALLQFLQANAAAQQPGGLPGDQANYAPAPMGLGGPPSPASAPQISPGGTAIPSAPVGDVPLPQPRPSMAALPAPAGPTDVSSVSRPSPAPAPMSMAGPPVAPAAAGNPIGNFFHGAARFVNGLATGGAPNMTAQALLAKGAAPVDVQAAAGNPELMKQLIDKYYGKPQAPTSIGNGYIVQDGKIVRAYEPDDKTPIGFQKTDKGLQPIAGGPADPAYLRSKAAGEIDPNAIHVLGKGGELYKTGPDGQPVIVHKNEEGADATLSDGTVKAMAAQYLAGDQKVLQNLGRGAQGAANIVKIREEIAAQAKAAGLDGKGIVDNFNEQAGALAGQRTVGTRAANISLAANEAKNMIDVAVKASEAVPRSQYVPWNKAVQAIQTGSSSPQLASFVAATNSLVNAYVRAVSPSGVPTDSMREHAYSMLNSAQSHEAYMAVIDTMKKEMDAAIKAPGQVQKELRRGDKPAEGGGAPAPAPEAVEAEMRRRGLLQ